MTFLLAYDLLHDAGDEKNLQIENYEHRKLIKRECGETMKEVWVKTGQIVIILIKAILNFLFDFQMRHHISIRGSVRPSVCPSTCPYVHPYVRYAFSKTKADPIIEVLMAHRVARLGLLKTLYANYSTFQARSNAGIHAFVLKTVQK